MPKRGVPNFHTTWYSSSRVDPSLYLPTVSVMQPSWLTRAVVITTTVWLLAVGESRAALAPLQHFKPHIVAHIATPPTIAFTRGAVAAVIVTPTPSPIPLNIPIKYSPPPSIPTGSHQDWLAAAGIAASDWGYVDYIVDNESGWQITIWNRSGSGAYGLGQALPATKMAAYGADYLTNPVTQLKWANSYALGRYGSWYQAKVFWEAHRWW